MIRVAIISFEHLHAFSYANAFHSLAETELVAAVEADAERRERVKKDFPFIPQVFADYREMLDKVETDAVIITSNNAQHAEIAIECARRGKHILCEKPIATNIADAQAMIRAARENKVTLMTAFPVRFSPVIAETKKLIESGEIGRVLGACTTNHGTMPGGWFIEKEKSGGGAVMDHTVHVVDVLRWMLNDEVSEVYAEYGTRLHDIKIDDVGQLIFRFKKGTIASLDTSWSRPKSFPIWGDVKIELRGEKQNVALDCFPQQVNLYDDTAMRHSGYNLGEDLDALMIAEFLSAVRENREPLVTGEDGLRAMEVALTAYEAGRSRKLQKLELAPV